MPLHCSHGRNQIVKNTELVLHHTISPALVYFMQDVMQDVPGGAGDGTSFGPRQPNQPFYTSPANRNILYNADRLCVFAYRILPAGSTMAPCRIRYEALAVDPGGGQAAHPAA